MLVGTAIQRYIKLHIEKEFTLLFVPMNYVNNHLHLEKTLYKITWNTRLMEYRKLKELCISITDCPHSTPEWTKTGKLVIRNQNIKNGKLNLSDPSYTNTDDFYKRIQRAIPQPGDIIITREAPMGEVCILPEGISCCLGQRMVLLKPNKYVCDNRYLLYILLSREVQHQISWSNGTGTTVSNLRVPNLKNLNIPYYTLHEQIKIANILGTIDDKIDLNIVINDYLAQTAQAIYKSWFVDFEPWGGVMPDDWKTGNLGEFVTIKRGGSPRPIQDFLSDSGYRWLKISDVTQTNVPFIFEIKEHIREQGLGKTVFLKAGSLVLSNSATPGIPKILAVDSCIHDGWLYFPESKLSNEFLYLYFSSIRPHLVSQGNGSVFVNLKAEIVKKLFAFLPSGGAIKDFQKIIDGIFENIYTLQNQSVSLAALRDSLLPRLMSGELSVTDI